jgi:type I restriction enzyme S subunit
VAFVRCGNQVLPEYLFQASCSEDFTRQLERRCNVTAQAGLYLGELAKVNIPLPPKSQQEKIAAILTSIDTAIEKTEALIEKYQHIKAGLMHDLFTRGVLANGTLRPPRDQAPELYQETAIGWIPREWRVVKVEDILSRIIDYRGKTPEKTISGIPLITAKNVRMGYINPEPREFIAESAYASWMTRGIPNMGDILFTTEAPLGNVAQVPSNERVAFAQRAIILQPSELIDALFLACRLMTEATQSAIARLSSGSTALGIKQSEFRKILIGYPSDKFEQKEIARRIDSFDSFLKEELKTLRKLQKQKLGLMQDLLTGKVPVKVEAPVSELVDG